MANQKQIGVVAPQCDLAMLTETLRTEQRNQNHSEDTVFVPCAAESSEASVILAATDAVVIGAEINSEEQGSKVEEILAMLKRARSEERRNALLAIALWGNQANSIALQTNNPALVSTNEPQDLSKLLDERLRRTLPLIRPADVATRYRFLSELFSRAKEELESVLQSNEANSPSGITAQAAHDLLAAQTKVAELEQNIAILEAEIAALNAECERLKEAEKETHGDMQAIISELREARLETENSVRQRTSQIKEVENKLVEAEDESQRVSELTNELMADCERLEAEKTEVTESLTSELNELKEKLAAIEEEKQLSQNDLEVFQTNLREMTEEREKLSLQVAQMQEEISAYTLEKTTWQAEIETLQNELTEARQGVAPAVNMSVVERAAEEVASLQYELEELKRTLADSEELRRDHEQTLDTLQAQYEEEFAQLKQHTAFLEDQLKSSEIERNSLHEKLETEDLLSGDFAPDSLEGKFRSLQEEYMADMADAFRQKQELEKKITNLEQLNQKLEQGLRNPDRYFEEQIEAAMAERIDFEKQCIEKERETFEMANLLKGMQSLLDNEKAAKADLENRLAEISKTHTVFQPLIEQAAESNVDLEEFLVSLMSGQSPSSEMSNRADADELSNLHSQLAALEEERNLLREEHAKLREQPKALASEPLSLTNNQKLKELLEQTENRFKQEEMRLLEIQNHAETRIAEAFSIAYEYADYVTILEKDFQKQLAQLKAATKDEVSLAVDAEQFDENDQPLPSEFIFNVM